MYATKLAIGTMLAQKNESNKEQAIYYLNQTFVVYEIRYLYLEKLCLVMVFANKKLRYYMLNQTTYVIAKANPLKSMMNKTYKNSRTSKWIMHLTKFDLQFICQKFIKIQVIADYLIEASLCDDKPLIVELSDEHIFQLDEREILVDLQEDLDMVIYFD